MNKFWKEVLSWAKELAIAIVIVLIFNIFFVASTVYNVSMNPTLVEGDIILLGRLGEIQKGDIVSFKSILTITEKDVKSLNFFQRFFNKAGDRKNLIKRVLASPGDNIEIKSGILYVNGYEVKEPYVKNAYLAKDVPLTMLGEDEYFVAGDNRANSYDSRDFGAVKREDIIGKVLIRFWPFNRIGTP